MSTSYKEFTDIDGEPVEFEWNSSQDLHRCRFFKRFRIIRKSGTLNFRSLQTGSSSCQCSTTLVGQEKEICISNSEKVKGHAKRFSRGHWTFLGPGGVKKWYELFLFHLKENGDSTVAQMVERLKDTGPSVFKSISALSRGILKKKDGRDTIHVNADASNTEL